MFLSFAFLSVSSLLGCNAFLSSSNVNFHGPITVEADGMHNVHITYRQPVNGRLSIHYGDCGLEDQNHSHHLLGSTHVGRHRLARRHEEWKNNRPTKFVWLPPSDIHNGGCLHAFANGELVGTSTPVTVTRRKARRGKSFADIADPEGPWFDGVEYLKQKEPDQIFVAQAKSKKIGIIGAGMSGLMTAVSCAHLHISDYH
jgi:hypothetical protein